MMNPKVDITWYYVGHPTTVTSSQIKFRISLLFFLPLLITGLPQKYNRYFCEVYLNLRYMGVSIFLLQAENCWRLIFAELTESIT